MMISISLRNRYKEYPCSSSDNRLKNTPPIKVKQKKQGRNKENQNKYEKNSGIVVEIGANLDMKIFSFLCCMNMSSLL